MKDKVIMINEVYGALSSESEHTRYKSEKEHNENCQTCKIAKLFEQCEFYEQISNISNDESVNFHLTRLSALAFVLGYHFRLAEEMENTFKGEKDATT